MQGGTWCPPGGIWGRMVDTVLKPLVPTTLPRPDNPPLSPCPACFGGLAGADGLPTGCRQRLSLASAATLLECGRGVVRRGHERALDQQHRRHHSTQFPVQLEPVGCGAGYHGGAVRTAVPSRPATIVGVAITAVPTSSPRWLLQGDIDGFLGLGLDSLITILLPQFRIRGWGCEATWPSGALWQGCGESPVVACHPGTPAFAIR